MSQLLDHGHPHAFQYPVGRVWEENELVVKRINQRIATEATILQSAITTAVAGFGKDGGRAARKAFTEMIKGLVDEP